MSTKPLTLAPPISPRRSANRNEVAEFFGVSPNAVGEWARRGCPVVTPGERGKPAVYDLLEVARWRFGSAQQSSSSTVDPELMTPKERLDYYKGTRERMAMEVDRGDLIKAADAELAWSQHITEAKQALLALPSKLAPEVAPITDPKRIAEIVKTQIYTVLVNLAGGQNV